MAASSIGSQYVPGKCKVSGFLKSWRFPTRWLQGLMTVHTPREPNFTPHLAESCRGFCYPIWLLATSPCSHMLPVPEFESWLAEN